MFMGFAKKMMGNGDNGDGIVQLRLLILYFCCNFDDCDCDYRLRSCDAGEDDTWKKRKMLGGIATLIPNAGHHVLQKG